MSGQVTGDSPFGKALIKQAARSDINTFLDVGTWTGQGLYLSARGTLI